MIGRGAIVECLVTCILGQASYIVKECAYMRQFSSSGIEIQVCSYSFRLVQDPQRVFYLEADVGIVLIAPVKEIVGEFLKPG